MANPIRIGLVALLAVVAFAVLGAAFTVHQTEHALVLRFGQTIRAVKDPGLYFKVPLIDSVVKLDNRILDFDNRNSPIELIAKDQKRIVVDSFTRYRIVDPLKFYQTVNNIPGAQLRLSNIVDSNLRGVLADATFLDLVKDKRSELQEEIRKDSNKLAEGFGIRIVDVRIRRADLPEQNSEAVFQRMKTDRIKEATDIRAQGQQEALGTRAKAEREVAEIRGKANKEAEEIRGDADAARNRIFAEAFGRDPEFFSFYRRMQAYVESLKAGDTRLVLTPDSEFLRYLNDPFGRARPAPAEPAAKPAAKP
jgi:membrane protease subunit HflC